MPSKPKYNEMMDTVYRFRLTSEQKSLLSRASASADTDNMSDFWRNYNLYTAELLLKVQAGELTTEQAGDLIAKYFDEHYATGKP